MHTLLQVSSHEVFWWNISSCARVNGHLCGATYLASLSKVLRRSAPPPMWGSDMQRYFVTESSNSAQENFKIHHPMAHQTQLFGPVYKNVAATYRLSRSQHRNRAFVLYINNTNLSVTTRNANTRQLYNYHKFPYEFYRHHKGFK
jgi:hypothetical protein